MFQSTKSQRRKIKKALRAHDYVYLCKAVLFHARLSHLFSFTRGEYKMWVFYTPFAFWLWSERARERSDEAFYRRFLREGDTVVDVGANIGLCTLLSARIVGTNGHVYSYEPHPRTYNQLCKNIKLNSLTQVTAYNLGASNEEEKTLFTDEYVTDINHVDTNGKVEVRLLPIDSILPKELTEVTLLKVDVEGYELFALKGAEHTLKRTRIVYFESCSSSFARYGYNSKDIFMYMETQGFSLYKTDEHFTLLKLDLDYKTLCGYENLIAVRESDVEWLQTRLQVIK